MDSIGIYLQIHRMKSQELQKKANRLYEMGEKWEAKSLKSPRKTIFFPFLRKRK